MTTAIVVAATASAVVVVLIALGRLSARVLARTAFEQRDSPDAKSRLAAADALARLAVRGHPNAFESLDRLTEDPDEAVRRASSRWVQQIGQRMGRLPLTTRFDQAELDRLKGRLLGPDEEERRRAADRVRQMGDPWTYQACIQIRRDARDAGAETRRRAARALGHLGDPLSAPFLLLALDDADASIREAAAVAAGQVRGWRCLGALATSAAADPDPAVRSAAQRSAASLRGSTADGR